MKVPSFLKPKPSLAEQVQLIELTTGERQIVDRFPLHFHVNGSFSSGELDSAAPPRALVVERRQAGVWLRRASMAPDFLCLLFGKEIEEDVQIQSNVEYQVQVGNRLFVFRYRPESGDWLQKLDPQKWYLIDLREDGKGREFRYEALQHWVETEAPDPDHFGFSIEGMEGVFPIRQLVTSGAGMAFASPSSTSADVFPGSASHDAHWSQDPGIDRNGPFLSPFCWERFDYGDVLHIATDERLQGDPVLGEESMLRFLATRFDRDGNALDPYGQVCSAIADPHTRHSLPHGFMELPQAIFSIVGAPGSGKSNYLSILINALQHTLFTQFGMVLRDADPAQNAPLNDMKNCLFGGGSIAQAALMKTQLDGRMYFKIKRDDRVISYPRPFIYTLGKAQGGEGLCNVVFYDNAGEHFEPGIEAALTSGAQHVAAADTLFFLVDPTTLPAFRKRLMSHPDPQLRQTGRIDQQDVLLSEMELRIRKALGLSVNQKVQKPLAVLLGKCDIWMDLMHPVEFQQPIQSNLLSQEALLHNSNLVRALLMELAPKIVANAESISPHVLYFPVSAFGHSPTELPGGSFAPDPMQINPYLIEIPTLWALSLKIANAFRIRPKPPSARLIRNVGSRLIPD
jgi:hypothetical protein